MTHCKGHHWTQGKVMPIITLPDSSTREFDHAVSILDIAADIGPGLAKATVAGRIDGRLVDACELITADAKVEIVTAKDDAGLEVIRHSFAHLIGHAVKQLYPSAKMAIGPTIENGFYYDIDCEEHITNDDLVTIEKRITQLIKTDYDVVKKMTPVAEARALFAQRDEPYKLELIDGLDESITEVGLYHHEEYVDMCRGPHVPNTRLLRSFKLMHLAGAYWRGNSDNKMLQRVYGTAWADKKALKAYLKRLEEAEKRDHRKLGKTLDLFHMQEEAPGMVFWHPNGWALYQQVEQYMRNMQNAHNYHEIKTPQIVDRSLWEKSGHWDKFASGMFTTGSESRDYAIKPMNCPCHVQVFNQGLRSYRDLPYRLAEFGSCHRNEPSGALHGIMRVRGFVQDDGHIFCAEKDIQTEVAEFISLLHEVYSDFGFTDIIYKLSTRPENRVGSDEIWDKSEKALGDALDAANLDWSILPGEGAFYGPKIEFSLKDCLGRVWQCGTIQADFSMPKRLDAQFVNEEGNRETPVMLHRAVIGSFERFLGILIEHHAGVLPAWLAPKQLAIMNITDKQADYCKDIASKLEKNGFRVIQDLRNEKIGFKIRERTLQKVPYLLVVGDNEVENGTVAVRTRSGEDLGAMTLDAFAEYLNGEVERKGRKDND
ncbi:MAG: threonyl-tRNA synthetase [Oceanospirillaceae bacterium]